MARTELGAWSAPRRVSFSARAPLIRVSLRLCNIYMLFPPMPQPRSGGSALPHANHKRWSNGRDHWPPMVGH